MKLSWIEEGAVYLILVLVVLFFNDFLVKSGIISYGWLDMIIFLVVYWGISGVVVKAIKGKDIEKENKTKSKEDKKVPEQEGDFLYRLFARKRKK